MGTTSEREDFSRRLRQLLHKAGIEAKGAVRLAQDFNDRYSGKPVTHQAAQKWLNGESIPMLAAT